MPMLQGAPNFRDLGGLPTRNGTRVRSGLLFRSNSLARLTADDLVVVRGLGLRTIVDLRTVGECERAPSSLVGEGVRIIASTKPDMAGLLEPVLRQPPSDEAGSRRRFSQFFAQVPELYAEEYAALFRALAEEETPLLINCSAGKDRTGIAVLLILEALGVKRELAIADYLLSGERLADDPAFRAMLSGTILNGFSALPAHARSIMLGVDREHAEAAFAAVERDHGSVEAYVIGRLGLSRAELAQIRSLLTEPA